MGRVPRIVPVRLLSSCKIALLNRARRQFNCSLSGSKHTLVEIPIAFVSHSIYDLELDWPTRPSDRLIASAPGKPGGLLLHRLLNYFENLFLEYLFVEFEGVGPDFFRIIFTRVESFKNAH